MAFFIFAAIYKTLGGENKNDAPTTPNFDPFLFSPPYIKRLVAKIKDAQKYTHLLLYRHAPHPLCRGAARREIKHTISNYMPLIPGQRNKRGGEMEGHRAGIQANRERTERHARAHARANC